MLERQPSSLTPEQLAVLRPPLKRAQEVMAELIDHPALAMRYQHELAFKNLMSIQGGANWHLPEEKWLTPTARVLHAMAGIMLPTSVKKGLSREGYKAHQKLEWRRGNFRIRLLECAVDLLRVHPEPDLPGVKRDTQKYATALGIARTEGRKKPKASPEQRILL
jgi:hypothetical protein